MATHSSILAWKIPWTEEPGGLYSPWGLKELDTTERQTHFKSRQEYWSGLPFPSPGELPNPGIEPRSPTMQAVSLPAEPLGRPKNTRMGSPSLLQGIFLTQESNWGLLHCMQILYQLSY